MGRPRTLPDAQPRACAFCGKVFTPPRKAWKRKFCSRYCNAARHCTPEKNRERGRRCAEQIAATKRGTGAGKGYVKWFGRHEHRVVMERMLGRPLRSGEIVHHEDENKRNNDPSNLVLLPNQAAHVRLHNKARAKAQHTKGAKSYGRIQES